MSKIEFSATVALLVCFGLLMLGMFFVAFGRAFVRRKKENTSAAVLPEIRDALVDYISGNNDLTCLREFATKRPADVTHAIMAFQGNLSGSALDRLLALTIEFSLLNSWIEETRSRDPIRRRAAFA